VKFPSCRSKRLLADYVLALLLFCWSVHVMIFPAGMDRIAAYRWMTINPQVIAGIGIFVAGCQFFSAVFMVAWARRLGAIAAGSIMFNFAVKVFEVQPEAHISSFYGGLALSNLILFFWPWM